MPSQSNYHIKEPLWLALVAVIGIVVGLKMSPTQEGSFFLNFEKDSSQISNGKVEEVLQFIDSRYVDEVNNDALVSSALSSIFSELDPHSGYLPPVELKDIDEEMSGAYQGIGVQTTLREDTIFIQHILQNSPAQEVGLKVGDRLLVVDTFQMSGTGKVYQELRKGLNFSENQTRTIMINRRGQNMSFEITSRSIPTPAVSSAYMIDEAVAYIKLDRFSENVYREFMEEIEKLVKPKMPFDLILDLRGNPGGYLPETIKILNQIFEEKNLLLVYTKDKNDRKKEYKTNGSRFYQVEKVAVLIDQASASASEIIAAAIQDWDRGLIIGETSFGKGLVQEQYKLKNGGAIRLTVSRYFTPSGRIIQKPYENELVNEQTDSTQYYTKKFKRKVQGSGGIKPDIEISSTPDRPNDCILILDEISFFIAKHYISMESRMSDSVFLEKYLEHVYQEYDIDKDQVCRDLILEAYEEVLVKNAKGTAEMVKLSNKEDKLVNKALSQFSKSDIFSF